MGDGRCRRTYWHLYHEGHLLRAMESLFMISNIILNLTKFFWLRFFKISITFNWCCNTKFPPESILNTNTLLIRSKLNICHWNKVNGLHCFGYKIIVT
jgi:hypothetical protein